MWPNDHEMIGCHGNLLWNLRIAHVNRMWCTGYNAIRCSYVGSFVAGSHWVNIKSVCTQRRESSWALSPGKSAENASDYGLDLCDFVEKLLFYPGNNVITFVDFCFVPFCDIKLWLHVQELCRIKGEYPLSLTVFYVCRSTFYTCLRFGGGLKSVVVVIVELRSFQTNPN